jgi:PAS domain-containing protein
MYSPFDDTEARTSTATGRRLASTMRSPVLWLTLCGALLVTAILAGTIIMIGEFRERALGNSERELENTVQLLTRHFDQQFEDSDTIAADVISQLQFSSIASPEAFRERMLTPRTHEILSSKASVLAYVGDIAIFDVNGELITWSRPLPAPAVNISGRAYFKTFTSAPQSPSILTEAVPSLINGHLNTVIAHRLVGENGVFIGVMVRRINPDNYEKFFATVVLGENAAISMFHVDGTMMARYPHVDAMIGQKLTSAPLLQRVLSTGGQHTMRILQSPVDQRNRLGSAAPLSHFPGVVLATSTVDVALADWQAQTRLLVAAALLAASVTALILFLIIRQIARQNREARHRLESERQRLDTALNNMTHGLVLYDASARIVTFNRRYIDMFNLSTEIVKPGCHFHDVIEHRKERGSFNGDVKEFCSAVMRNIAEGKVDCSIIHCADGRAVQTVSKPLAHGGWVATLEDITERRKLEQERDRNYTFLREIIDHIPSQITVKDAHDRRYLLVNSVAEAQFGVSRDVIVGKTAFDVFPKAAAEVVTGHDDVTLQSPRRPVSERAPLADPGHGRALHHLKADRYPRPIRAAPLHHQCR